MPLLSRVVKKARKAFQPPLKKQADLLSPARPDDEEACRPNESASFEVYDSRSKESIEDDKIFKAITTAENPTQSDVSSQDIFSSSLESKSSGKQIEKKGKKQPKVKKAKDSQKSDDVVFTPPGKRHQTSKTHKSDILPSQEQPKTKKTKKQSSKLNISLESDTSGFASQEILDDYIDFLDSTIERSPTPMPDNLTPAEQIAWLQEHRNVGLYVQCDKCNKFRYLKDIKDPLDLPKLWYCNMNRDKKRNKCSIPEDEIPMSVEIELIQNEYNAGSIVYARVGAYPWWPAMVDDDPDCLCYYWLEGLSDKPTHYNVTFFDNKEVTRAWVTPKNIVSFKAVENGSVSISQPTSKERRVFGSRLKVAKEQALDALGLDLLERLRKYCFITRWSKGIGDLEKHMSAKKRDKNDEKVEQKANKRVKNTHAQQEPPKKNTGGFKLDNFIRNSSDFSEVSDLDVFRKGWDAVPPSDASMSPISGITDIMESL